MLERSKWLLKIACLVLAAVVAWQLVQVWVQLNPFTRITIPDLPSLPQEAANQPGSPGMMPVAVPVSVPHAKAASNAVPSTATNAVPPALATGTNTNAVTPSKLAGAETNAAPLPDTIKKATNTASLLASNGPGTTATAPKSSVVKTAAPGAPGGRAVGANFNPGQRPMFGMKTASLPPAIQTRVDRIVESEILGPFIRPQPAALIGIAGNFAFVRAPTGQTGLIKEGDELGGLKLLRIGINRVLVEEQGQKKELTIFSGYGGESLLPKQETSHETNH